ncbi:MAG: phosphoribosylformylglycinamidine synthase I [Pirellulales bacterium]
MRVLVLRAPGTNCDLETAYAFERAGAQADRLHIGAVLDSSQRLADYQVLCLPGGFSYGDDLGAGRIQAVQLRLRLADAIRRFRDEGKLILGICNGFQVLMQSGMLLEEDSQAGTTATLTWNESGKFEDRWVHLKAAAGQCVFLRGVERMYLPVAHAEGRFVGRSPEALAALDRAGQLVLRYASCSGSNFPSYPENPNGSILAIAGVCDASGRVFGLMPHPERHIDRTQHPRWTRGEGGPTGEGLRVFENAVEYFKS